MGERIELVKRAFAGEAVERIPVMAHNFLMAVREAGFTQRRFRENPDVMVKVMTEATLRYDLDCVLLDVDTALLASACGADVIYPDDLAAVAKGTQPTPLEELPEKIASIDITASPRVRHYLEAAERLVEWGNENDRFIRINADQGAFSLACILTGMDEFMMDLLDEDYEDDINRLLDATYKVSLKMHELCFATGAHMTSYGNSSEGCSVISPAMFRRFAKERETRLAVDLKARGIPYLCHICGDVNPILPDLVETGCPAFELDWKTDVGRVFEAAHGRFTLSGNVDPALFVTGSPEEVYAAARQVCDMFRGKGGLVLCSGCALGPNTKSENVRAFVRAVQP
jgi:uroporphyrinogen decarboxylase